MSNKEIKFLFTPYFIDKPSSSHPRLDLNNELFLEDDIQIEGGLHGK